MSDSSNQVENSSHPTWQRTKPEAADTYNKVLNQDFDIITSNHQINHDTISPGESDNCITYSICCKSNVREVNQMHETGKFGYCKVLLLWNLIAILKYEKELPDLAQTTFYFYNIPLSRYTCIFECHQLILITIATSAMQFYAIWEKHNRMLLWFCCDNLSRSNQAWRKERATEKQWRWMLYVICVCSGLSCNKLINPSNVRLNCYFMCL